ncbi:symmetrical bis(5'-nucleosyl)-tetraphosphatase [Granulosicoccaceae sp. 1_MG-2023]|nr:symmetrical bis(5'-nucleosyl)-tetraphosphatase [Granulosicoccaceae sp. 1_MG-2023]
MTTYAVGDLQGCLEPLQRLLDAVHFDPARDKLWLCGDLINRGPDSLGCLRFVKSLGDAAETVLGNHDLHLLAVAAGARKASSKDTLEAILRAEDAPELLDWLRRRPLLLVEENGPHVLSHAGLHPHWDRATALREAAFVESALRADNYRELFTFMYGNSPARWREGREGEKRLRFAINVLTRMRYCRRDGELDFKEKDSPGTQPESLLPWYEVADRRHEDMKVIFGHWSTVGTPSAHDVVALDSGCVWGGFLTAYALQTGVYTRLRCPQAQAPKKR